jgi:hypothetical protein
VHGQHLHGLGRQGRLGLPRRCRMRPSRSTPRGENGRYLLLVVRPFGGVSKPALCAPAYSAALPARDRVHADRHSRGQR